MATHTYGDGTTVDITEGAELVKDENGQLLYWREPPITPEGQLHPHQVDGYESRFPRDGSTRRVLGHITDDDHVGRGPRNTAARLAQELAEDPFSPKFVKTDDEEHDVALVQSHLNALESAGLVERRADGTYCVTSTGLVELRN